MVYRSPKKKEETGTDEIDNSEWDGMGYVKEEARCLKREEERRKVSVTISEAKSTVYIKLNQFKIIKELV